VTVAVHLTHKRPSTGSGGSQGSAAHPPEMKPGAQRMTDQWPVGISGLSGCPGIPGTTVQHFGMVQNDETPSRSFKLFKIGWLNTRNI